MKAAALVVGLATSAWAHGGDPRIADIRFPPQRPGEVWISIDNRGLFALRDGAFGWLCDEAVVPVAGFNGVAPVGDGEVFIATGRSGVRRGVDRGCAFDGVPGALEDHVTEGPLVHPARPEEVLTSTSTLGVPNDVYLSEDGGLSWSAAGLASMGRIRSLVRSPADPERVYAADGAGSARSDDGGRTFTRAALPADPNPEGGGVDPSEFTILAAHPLVADRLYGVVARFPDSYLFASEDAGETWTPLTTLPDAPDSLVVDEGGDGLLLTTPFEGAFRSSDGGQSWTRPDPPDPSLVIGCLRSDPAGGRIWACGRGFPAALWVVGYSDDFGETWTGAMSGFGVATEPWPCPDDSPTATACGVICVPENPECVPPADGGVPQPPGDARVADGGSGDSGPTEDGGRAPRPNSDAGTEGGGSGGCDAARGSPIAPWLALLLLFRRRER